jgi:hypothetical protein
VVDVAVGRAPWRSSQVIANYKEIQIHGELRFKDHVRWGGGCSPSSSFAPPPPAPPAVSTPLPPLPPIHSCALSPGPPTLHAPPPPHTCVLVPCTHTPSPVHARPPPTHTHTCAHAHKHPRRCVLAHLCTPLPAAACRWAAAWWWTACTRATQSTKPSWRTSPPPPGAPWCGWRSPRRWRPAVWLPLRRPPGLPPNWCVPAACAAARNVSLS